MQTIEILFQSASKNHGLTLTNWQVRQLVAYITGVDNMLSAYVNEYSPDLLLTLTEQAVIEGEIVEDGDDEETEENGRDSVNERLDSPSQEEE